jgi:hypothetical protein
MEHVYDMRGAAWVWSENLKERDDLEDPSVGVRVILKPSLNK